MMTSPRSEGDRFLTYKGYNIVVRKEGRIACVVGWIKRWKLDPAYICDIAFYQQAAYATICQNQMVGRQISFHKYMLPPCK